MNLCRRCKQDFSSLSGFDDHRVGKHAYLYDLDHPDGRRCLATDELIDLGWRRDKHGRWRLPLSQDASLRFAQSLYGSEKSEVGGQVV